MGAPQYEQAGADVAGSGTTNTIPRWTGATTLGDSGLIDDGTQVYTTTRKVGFGTAAPIARTHVNAGGVAQLGAVTVRINTAITEDQTTYRGLYLGWDTAGQTGVIAPSTAAVGSNLAFWTFSGTAWGERARIDSAGNFGLNTSTASSGFATMTLNGSTAGTKANNCGLQLNYNAGGFGGGSITTVGAAGGGLDFWTYTGNIGSEIYQRIYRIDTSGNLILNTANTGATIQAAGTSQGLKLQGTGGTNNTDPNVLDFYADGGTANSGGVTWTPAISFGGATTGITYTTQVGRYTRVGNTVIAHGYIQLSSKGSATGVVTITGLPTSSNTANLYAAASLSFAINITTTGQLVGRINPNEAQVRLGQFTAAGAFSALTDAAFANNSEISFTIAYPVT